MSGILWRRRWLRVGALLAAPLGWLGVVYLGSLVVLLVAAFWSLDDFAGLISHELSTDNFKLIWQEPVYRKIVWRTVSIAALVTITDILLAFPIAFYMARVVRPRMRGAARRRRADAAVGVLPGEGLRVADDVRQRRDHQLGCSTRSGCTCRSRATYGSGSSCRTCGCRT